MLVILVIKPQASTACEFLVSDICLRLLNYSEAQMESVGVFLSMLREILHNGFKKGKMY